MKLLQVFAVALFLLTGHVAFASQEVSGLCSGCSQSSKEKMAVSWANENITPAEAGHGVRKHYIVIDVEAESITKFEMHKFLPSRDLSRASVAKEVEPEPEDLEKVGSLFSEVNTIHSIFETIKIPRNVIENAWEFVGCAYCTNEVTDYLRHRDDVVKAFQRIKKTLRGLNAVSGTLDKAWILALESGGVVHAEISLIHADQFLVMETLKVLDLNDNVVPLNASDLYDGMPLKGDINHYNDLQRYIAAFGFKFEIRQGQVTVTEA